MNNSNYIASELKDQGINIPNGLKSPMNVPLGYFDDFSDSVIELIKDEDFLASLPKKMPFDVETNYFNLFENDILSTIKTENFIASLPKSIPFEINATYLDSLEISILAQIKAENNIESLSKTMPFALPIGYFEGLETELKAKIEIQKKGITPLRVIRTKTQVFSIAASIILFLGIGFLFLKPTKTINVEQQLAQISTNEINAYILKHQAEFTTDIATETIDETSVDVNKLENEIIESQINNLSKEDLKNYL
jgi:hypothetical protein